MSRILFGLILLAALGSAGGQDAYPSKPIRILVGYAAGGGNDIIVRVMQPEMQKGLGQPVIVENKPGAQGIIAAELAAKSRARRLHHLDGAERADDHQPRDLLQAAATRRRATSRRSR